MLRISGVRRAGFVAFRFECEEMPRYEIDQQAGKDVEDEVDQMVSEHTEPVEMVIHRKGQGG